MKNLNNGLFEVIKLNDEKCSVLGGGIKTGTWALRKLSDGRMFLTNSGSVCTFPKRKVAFNVANQLVSEYEK